MNITTERTRKSSLWIPGLSALFFNIFLSFGTTFAQTDASTGIVPPSGPMLASAPDYSQWVITFTYPEERDQKPGASPVAETQTRTITTRKTGKIVHEESVSAQGNKRDDWYIGDNEYSKVAASAPWSLVQSQNNKPLFPPNGFRDLDWVSEKNFIGMAKCAGHPCLVFTPISTGPVTAKVAAELLANTETLPMIAYIDAESRLPVQVDQGKILRVYAFLPPPTEMQVAPPDLTKELKKAEDLRNRFNRSLQSN